MPISKKTIDYTSASHDILNNDQLADIGEYNRILDLARQQALVIIQTGELEAATIIEQAQAELNQHQEQALDLLQQVEAQNTQKISETQVTIEAMLNEATGSVQNIIDNSEQTTSKAVWEKAQDLIAKLEQERASFYSNAQDVIKFSLVQIIKKITTDLDMQSKMHILAGQIFDKAREVEIATLYFSAKDFTDLPQFNIPQGWKVDKDIMLESGACRLVGAGGEWKTSINIIERKILQAFECNELDIEDDENDKQN
jgi:hypothetical protein